MRQRRRCGRIRRGGLPA